MAALINYTTLIIIGFYLVYEGGMRMILFPPARIAGSPDASSPTMPVFHPCARARRQVLRLRTPRGPGPARSCTPG